jgi:hypothetical protein
MLSVCLLYGGIKEVFMKRVSFGLVLLVSFLVAGVRAQIMSNPAEWYINNSRYSIRVFNGMIANSMLRKVAKAKGAQPVRNTPHATGYTLFNQNPKSTLPKLLAQKSGVSAQEQQQTERILESFISLYKQTARKDGFPSNDLAYAFEYFVVNNYHIYHDLMDVPYEKDPRVKRASDSFGRIQAINEKKMLRVTLSQERAIYDQFKTVLATNPEIQRMSDAEKQEGAELFVILFGVVYSSYMTGINHQDEKLTEQARQTARDGLEKLLGVSVSRIKISDKGLEL